MKDDESPFMTEEAGIATSVSATRLVWFDMPEQPDRVFRPDRYRLDLCLTPRPENMRINYCDHWDTHRFARVGEMFLIPPDEPVRIKADTAVRQTSIVCDLDAGAIDRWLGEDFHWTDRRLEACLDISSNAIRHLLRRLASEARDPGFAGLMLAELMVGQLALELVRYCDRVIDVPMSGGLSSWRLRLIDERLKEVRAPPTLTELAGTCNISVRQLTRGFRASRGCSIGEYVAQNRIETAKRMLGRGQGIEEIAAILGFSSAASFSYAFRRMIGITPRQFLLRVLRTRH